MELIESKVSAACIQRKRSKEMQETVQVVLAHLRRLQRLPRLQQSDRDRRLDGRVMFVVLDFEIFVFVIEDRGGSAPYGKSWVVEGLAAQLFFDLLFVIGVDVAVSARPDEITHLQVALLGQHVGEQGIAGDVEGHTQKMSALRW